MMFEIETKGALIDISMNRPPVNAIDRTWLSEFHATLDRLEKAYDARVVRIRSKSNLIDEAFAWAREAAALSPTALRFQT